MEPTSNQNQGGAQKKQNRGGRGQKNIVEITEVEKTFTTTIIPTIIATLPNIQSTLNNIKPNIIILISNNKFFTVHKCIFAQNTEI